MGRRTRGETGGEHTRKTQVSVWIDEDLVARWRLNGRPVTLGPILEKGLKEALDRLGYR